jgi:hypothetical protein
MLTVLLFICLATVSDIKKLWMFVMSICFTSVIVVKYTLKKILDVETNEINKMHFLTFLCLKGL